MQSISSAGRATPAPASVVSSFAAALAAAKAQTAAAQTQAPTTAPSGRQQSLPIVSAAMAATYQSDPDYGPFIVADTAANIQQRLLELNGYGRMVEIRVTDATPMTLAWDAYQHTGKARAKISTPYKLQLTGVGLASVAGPEDDPHVLTYGVADVGANIQASIAVLGRLKKASAIATTDGVKPVFKLAASELSGRKGVFAKMTSPYSLAITQAGIDVALQLAKDKRVTSIATVVLSYARYKANETALKDLMRRKLVGAVTIQDSYGHVQAHKQELAGRLAAGSVTNVVVAGSLREVQANLAAISSLRKSGSVTGVTVNQPLAAAIGNLDALQDLAKRQAIDTIAITDRGQTAAMTADRYVDHLAAINLMTGNFTIEPTSAHFKLNYVDSPTELPGVIATASDDFKHALSTAKAILMANLADDVTLTIGICAETNGGKQIYGGNSSIRYGQGFDFAAYRDLLKSHLSGPAAALDTLPTSSPTPSRTTWNASVAQAQAWKLDQSGALAGIARAGAENYFSTYSVLLHEITEVMGRQSPSQDLYRYTAKGKLAAAPASSGNSDYFSINKGAVPLAYFASYQGGYNDFYPKRATDSVLPGYDPFNFFTISVTGPSNTAQDFTALDLIQMGALGFKLSNRAKRTVASAAAKDPYLASALKA